MSEDWDEIDEIKKRLEVLADECAEDDAKSIQVAIEKLDFLQMLLGEIDKLRDCFADIDEQYTLDLKTFPSELNSIELAASAAALSDMLRVLGARIRSSHLARLEAALVDLVVGGPPSGMFQPQPHKGRRADVPRVQQIKGALAGLMQVQQQSGMTRQEASAWIANNISPELAGRISGTPITARMVEEWLDRYGGRHPPANAGGTAFKNFSRWDKPLSKRKLREITEKLAERLPLRSRKPN